MFTDLFLVSFRILYPALGLAMAVSREADVAVWLHNKLGSTDDLWSGSSICSQLSRDRLLSIQDCFHTLQPHVKVKLMLAFLHMPKRNVEEWRPEINEILQMAQDDTDQWVAMTGNIMRTFADSGTINSDVDGHHHFFHEIAADMKKVVRKTQDVGMTPMECCYLSRNAQQSVTGQPHQPVKHFALKRKPKSAALRAELLHKSTEAANHLKRTGGSSVPYKIRSSAKILDDNTPMRGIPSSRLPHAHGGSFAGSLSRSFAGNTPLGQRANSQREGGIKLLAIEEMPVGPKEAKRRRKEKEREAIELQKKEKEAQAATPDYAAGLVAPGVPNITPTTVSGPSGPSYIPAGGNRPVVVTSLVTQPALVSTTQLARENLETQLKNQVSAQGVTVGHMQSSSVETIRIQTPQAITTPQIVASTAVPGALQPGSTTVLQPKQNQPGTAPANTTPNQNPAQPNQQKKGLSLTREQMLAAQEMFRTSNKVTRPEKALILGFMAGSRDNPCPQQGDIVNIRLSEDFDSIQQPDMTFKPMVVDTYIQMNYATGEWRRVKKYRERELDVDGD